MQIETLDNTKKARKIRTKLIYPISRLRSIVKTSKSTVKQGNRIFVGTSFTKQAKGLLIKLSRPEVAVNGTVQVMPKDYYIASGQRTDDNDATRDGYSSDQVHQAILNYMEIEKRKMRQPKFALDKVSQDDLDAEEAIRAQLYGDPSMPGIGGIAPPIQTFMQAGSAATEPVQSVPTVAVGILADDVANDMEPSDTVPNTEPFEVVETP